jgi:N utilization substance protein A
MERSDSQVFAPLPEEGDIADVRLAEIEGMNLATVAVLEEAGFRTLNDIIDLEREDFLKLPGIAPEEADRIMSILDELTEEGEEDGGGPQGASAGGDGDDAAE